MEQILKEYEIIFSYLPLYYLFAIVCEKIYYVH